MQYANALPENIVGALLRIGERHFAPLMEKPEARALWWPRFQRIAHWFAKWEAARRGDIAAIAAEIRGEIKIPLDNARMFTLSARADRIERHGKRLRHSRLQDRPTADRKAVRMDYRHSSRWRQRSSARAASPISMRAPP